MKSNIVTQRVTQEDYGTDGKGRNKRKLTRNFRFVAAFSVCSVIFLRSYKSISRDVVNRFEHVFNLRQSHFFDIGRVSHEAIERGHAFAWRVELIEEFIGYSRGDRGAVAPRDEIFVNEDRAIGLLDAAFNRPPVIRVQAAQIDHLDADLFIGGLFGGDQRTLNQSAISDDSQIAPFARDFGFAERDHEIRSRIATLVVGLAV